MLNLPSSLAVPFSFLSHSDLWLPGLSVSIPEKHGPRIATWTQMGLDLAQSDWVREEGWTGGQILYGQMGPHLWLLTLFLHIYLLSRQIFIECLPCAKPCTSYQGDSGNQNRQDPCSGRLTN